LFAGGLVPPIVFFFVFRLRNNHRRDKRIDERSASNTINP